MRALHGAILDLRVSVLAAVTRREGITVGLDVIVKLAERLSDRAALAELRRRSTAIAWLRRMLQRSGDTR
jgi:hypothetical protein